MTSKPIIETLFPPLRKWCRIWYNTIYGVGPLAYIGWCAIWTHWEVFSLLWCSLVQFHAIGQHLPTQSRHHAVAVRSLYYLVLVFPLCAYTFIQSISPAPPSRVQSRVPASSSILLTCASSSLSSSLSSLVETTPTHTRSTYPIYIAYLHKF
jgi:hypothetical protein